MGPQVVKNDRYGSPGIYGARDIWFPCVYVHVFTSRANAHIHEIVLGRDVWASSFPTTLNPKPSAPNAEKDLLLEGSQLRGAVDLEVLHLAQSLGFGVYYTPKPKF